jgi:tRNA (cytidine32/uridine32-2'-O)-methyltransferase
MNRLAAIRIVLVGTRHPGNIGSSVRAMKTMGLTQLWLVAPEKFPHPDAIKMAAEAADLLATVRIVETLDDAISDCSMAIATSKRQRGADWPALDINQTVDQLLENCATRNVALVFGPEPAGLTSADLYRCQYRSYLPTSDDCTSLNLAQAVQIYAYELLRAESRDLKPVPGPDLAPLAELELLYEHLLRVLVDLEFPRRNPEQLMLRVRTIFNRAGLVDRDLRLWRGILARIEERIKTDR